MYTVKSSRVYNLHIMLWLLIFQKDIMAYITPITGTVHYRTHRGLYIFKIIRIYLSTEENRDSICGFFTS